MCHFADRENWPKQLYVIPEHSFAVDCGDINLTLSEEHSELSWGEYDDTNNRLNWDSNKVALWELHERLRDSSLPKPENV